MCGFAGFVVTDGDFDALRVVDRMGRRIAHRGPDDSSCYVEGRMALAFRRLSIIDLAGGRQPIANEDGSCVLVLNGEIYNFRELREELRRRGHTFSTGSDAEVVLHGYEEYGRGVLDRLRGMFAFAIWNKRSETLFCARDIFGIKPLYYYRENGAFLFGSEIKCFLEHPGFEARVERSLIPDYLSYEYLPDDRTLFQGVRKLLPAHWIEWSPRGFRTGCYCNLAFCPDESLTLEEWAKCVEAALDDSVAAHQVADVEVGGFLSSGVDSSYLVERVSKTGNRIRTFSVGYEDGQLSELAAAQRFARQLGVRNIGCTVSADEFFDAMPDIQYFMDEPLPNPSENPLFFLARNAARSVKVVLSGEGADELFGGYPNYLQEGHTTAYERRVPQALRTALGRAAAGMPPFKGRRFLMRGACEPWQRNSRADYVFGADERLRYLVGDIREEAMRRPSPQEGSRRYFEEARRLGADSVTQLQYADLKTWLPYDILLKADRMSMAHSLELRVPYLDRCVLDVALRLPTRFRVRGDSAKVALRAAAARRLPAEVAQREKLGFPSPLATWLREGRFRERVREAFAGSVAREFFVPDELLRLLDEHCAGTSRMQQIWSFYSFIVWHEQFFGSGDRARRHA